MYNNYELLRKREELEQRLKDLLQGLRKKKQELTKSTYESSITDLVYKLVRDNK